MCLLLVYVYVVCLRGCPATLLRFDVFPFSPLVSIVVPCLCLLFVILCMLFVCVVLRFDNICSRGGPGPPPGVAATRTATMAQPGSAPPTISSLDLPSCRRCRCYGRSANEESGISGLRLSRIVSFKGWNSQVRWEFLINLDSETRFVDSQYSDWP